MRRLVLIAALALAGCATGPKMTAGQSLYLAYGSYGAAARSFADYAKGPTASPTIVHEGRKIVTSAPVTAAVAFGRAYVACRVDHNAETKGIVCIDWDFSKPSSIAITLRATAATVLGLVAKGKGQ